jgi:hypothetical protein
MALTAIAGFAQQPQTGDYIYVYEKDGNVLSFLREEIVDMGYSNFDTLGVAHDEVVSQIISLGEEAHIIPLADIVGDFLAPEGILLTSGIIAHRARDLKEALERNGFSIFETKEKDGWVAYTCKKRT